MAEKNEKANGETKCEKSVSSIDLQSVTASKWVKSRELNNHKYLYVKTIELLSKIDE